MATYVKFIEYLSMGITITIFKQLPYLQT